MTTCGCWATCSRRPLRCRRCCASPGTGAGPTVSTGTTWSACQRPPRP
jgi:hypothetical protein